MGGIFGARYFADYDWEVAPVIIVPPPPPGGVGWQHGIPRSTAMVRVPAKIRLRGVELKIEIGHLTAKGRAKTILESICGEFEFGMPKVSGASSIKLIGTEIEFQSSHEEPHSSVTLGRIHALKPDDAEAAMLLFISNV